MWGSKSNALSGDKRYLQHAHFVAQIHLNFAKPRNAAYQFFAKRIIEKTKFNFQKENIWDTKIPPEEMYYNILLELFAKDLNRRRVKFFMIAINGTLDQLTYIKEMVYELDKKGFLNYIEVVPWFENVTNYESPEGHMWGKKAHRIIGTKLSEITKQRFIRVKINK